MKSFIPKNIKLQKAELDNFFSKARLNSDEKKNEEMLSEARKSMDSLMSSYNQLMGSDKVDKVYIEDFKSCYQNALKNLNLNLKAEEISDVPDKEDCVKRTERLWKYMGVHTLRKEDAQSLRDTLERDMDDDFDSALRAADFSDILHSSERFKDNADQITKDLDILHRAGVQMSAAAEERQAVGEAVQDIYEQLQKSGCQVDGLAAFYVKDSETISAYTKACEDVIYGTLQIHPNWPQKKDEDEKVRYRDPEELLLEGMQKKPVYASDEKKAQKEAEKKDAKENDAQRINEKEVREAVEKSAGAVAENTKLVQESLGKLADGTKTRPLTDEDLVNGMAAMQKGMLQKKQILRYLQGLQEARERNYRNNGSLENNLLQERRDTIRDIGEEYQARREVTPVLVEKKERLDAIDNVLINVTKHPQLLFLSMILMGLNPFLAIGLSVLAAFGKDLVQDIYKNLPREDRSNLENRPVQQPQPVDNRQIEEYQKKLAAAQQMINEQTLLCRKLAQRDLAMRQMVQRICNHMYKEQAEKERSKAAEEKKKPQTKVQTEERKPEIKEHTKETQKKPVL